MNIAQLLDYQKLDRELFNIEKRLKDSKNKALASEMYDNMKTAQEKSHKLEEKAGNILVEIEKIKNQYKIQEDKISELTDKNIDGLSKEEIEKFSAIKDKLSQNLIILEKKLTALAENVNAILSEFNKTIKIFNSSKEQYSLSKSAFDKEAEGVEQEKKQIMQKLAIQAKNIDAKLMESYTKRRSENIFPVVVPLNGNCCGGCHMELPYANISKLESDGILTCEHCHRLIYKN